MLPTEELNIMTYLYYFNGAGVASGDFNNDGRIDLFFAGNNSPCKLYLNEGNWKFREVTSLTGINTEGEWSTGVSVVDINNDGLTDIYVNQVGNFRDFKGRNKLFICTGVTDGIPAYVEKAAEYGLDFCGLATQSLFFDYDLDGDLDMYQLNHSVHENGTFGERRNFLG
ncbi:MAG TPA: VCBS repeat-containing protein, partial [Ohtaekwangia sp.]|nr:VCBS repeat-containing protein [Ohtaekwangia sp.]